jgi:adenine-specific DNA-methyltransferase
MAGKKGKRPKQVDSTKHRDRRVNIPTEELRDFVAEDEASPEAVLYPRDPSLDPQLVWMGKDAQDREDLAVPAVPVYIQEKIHPQAIIEDLRRQAKQDAPQEQLTFFDDFNGLEFQDLIDFYQHDQNWTNRMILGDSLLVMTSLAEKEGLKGQVQMIYIDPPYGIKFGSNWQVSTRRTAVKDGKAEDVTRQPEQVKAFRDTWELGIHSYLSYLRDRLVVARELLTDSGSVFVQMGDENVHLVRAVLDEVFGADGYMCEIAFEKRGAQPSKYLPTTNDFIVWYCRNPDACRYRQLYVQKGSGAEATLPYLELPTGERRRARRSERLAPRSLPPGSRFYTTSDLTSSHFYESPPFQWRGRKYEPGGRYWSTSPSGLRNLDLADRLVRAGKTIRMVRYLDDWPVAPLTNLWTDTAFTSFQEEKLYVVQTAQRVIERCVLMTTDPGDLVLDPTCGSGTTAFVAEQWARRWITIDTSRVALALARTRLMSARYPYYLLADSPEGIKKASDMAGQHVPVPLPKTNDDVKQGFVYERVPHIMLKDIANNQEIDEIHERWAEQLEPIRLELNEQVGQSWEPWQVPCEPGKDWAVPARKLLEEWWSLRRQRREEIDDSIARHSDSETLYDQPYQDPKRLRVSGPFTVESLSPHRFMAVDEPAPATETDGRRAHAGEFELMIVDNLKTAGVQNTIKNERLQFERLEAYAGEWLQAEGEYTERDGTLRRVAVSIGPEHGTVGPQHIKEAAKEAVRGVGFDLLIVCGFAFDPHVSEEARRYGELTVLPARMNPDLAMGDTLLKKTGAGNLFMVFGEPDLEVRRDDGQISVEIKGLDIYDPTTGEIRASSVDDIACWFIDTNYNEESFFVRHAYFTGAEKPYESLKRALRADIDEEAWSALYSTVSRPFDLPETGKIAVKVINHYGDEVLKVYDISAAGGGE